MSSPTNDPGGHLRDINDEKYFSLMAQALRVCARYKPMFGRGRKGGVTLDEFRQMYGSDPFYSWMGLDSPLMYAAHKAAGGMTSIYRQIGIGVQWVFCRILQDCLGLRAEQVSWTYKVPLPDGSARTLALDGRIQLSDVTDAEKRGRIDSWIRRAANSVLLSDSSQKQLRGCVFEVRQGYKSKDSKRQNADVANASNAYAHSYLPVVLLFSAQIDSDIAIRYAQAQWVLLRGSTSGTALDSTYVFCKEILGYDLAGFFQRNTSKLRKELEDVLVTLLQAHE